MTSVNDDMVYTQPYFVWFYALLYIKHTHTHTYTHTHIHSHTLMHIYTQMRHYAFLNISINKV